MSIKPVLLFGYGNPSRGDDALGWLLIEAIENSIQIDLDAIEILSDFQLQIEHALDLDGRDLVLFVDASVSGIDAYTLTQLQPEHDVSYTTHEMSPSAILQVYQSVNNTLPPPCFLLTISAEKFDLGDDLSVVAEHNLHKAYTFTERLLADPDLAKWQKLVGSHDVMII